MRVSLILRAVTKENLAHLKKIMDNAVAEAPQYLLKVKEQQKIIVFDKIRHLNRWYTKFIGLDEVKVFQERVTALQDQLLKTQTKRREINKHLSEIRQKAQEVQSQIQHVDRKEKFDVYCQLINDERTVLNMERAANATFQDYDQAERDLFTAFTNAVRDSQEKQRSQLEYSKYISLILSLVGSFLAFVYTVFWKHDLKMFIHDEVSSIKNMPKADIQQGLQQDFNQMKRTVIDAVQQINKDRSPQIVSVLPANQIDENLPFKIGACLFLGIVGCAILGSLFG